MLTKQPLKAPYFITLINLSSVVNYYIVVLKHRCQQHRYEDKIFVTARIYKGIKPTDTQKTRYSGEYNRRKQINQRKVHG